MKEGAQVWLSGPNCWKEETKLFTCDFRGMKRALGLRRGAPPVVKKWVGIFPMWTCLGNQPPWLLIFSVLPGHL